MLGRSFTFEEESTCCATDVAVVSYGSSIVASGVALLAMYILRELGVA